MSVKKCLQLIIGILILFCFAMEGAAGEKNFGDRVPTVNELIDALAPEPSITRSLKPARSESERTRSLRPTRSLKPAHSEKPTYSEALGPAISMQIGFGLNTYRLTRQAAQRLDVVGRAISSGLLRDYQFVIEGHTDASGNDRDNLLLSRRRAIAVKKYLVMRFNVDPNRLKTVGKGESEPLFADRPYASQNRRVKIISIGEE